MTKLISIVGPTSSGKTGLAVYLAKKFSGEIVSADSRQVYKYMDIGTGKDLKEYGKIKYHCIDVADPKSNFNLVKYLKKANKSIQNINKNNKIPFLVGGTGLYINAVVENYELKEEELDKKERERLESLEKTKLQKLVLSICKKNKVEMPLNNSDWNNPYRLIRFIEKNKNEYQKDKKSQNKYINLIIGIKTEKDILEKRIEKRLNIRLEKEKMLQEIWDLNHKHNVPWKKIISFGLEYKNVGLFLKNNKAYFEKLKSINYKNIKSTKIKTEYSKMKENLKNESINYAKKQMTWFNKNKNIIWIENDKNIYKNTEIIVKKFLS